MSIAQLNEVDLNLLVVLRALLETESVRATGQRLKKTPSAISHSLRRLREIFDDPLFVRDGQRVVATPFAQGLAAPLEESLGRLGLLLERRPRFSPGSVRRSFEVGTTDYVQLVMLPRVLERLLNEAPEVSIRCRSPGEHVDALVRDRTLDLAIGSNFQPLAGLMRSHLYNEELVAVRKKVPRQQPLTMETYLAADHVLVSPRGQTGSMIDSALGTRGLKRKVRLTTPHFLVALHLVARGGLMTTLPSRVARALGKTLPIVLDALPFPTAPFEVSLLYSEVYRFDPMHLWFRTLIKETSRI
jgi:DNA-binding transcriptional LysR family regulator